jgi:hypothetical protein
VTPKDLLRDLEKGERIEEDLVKMFQKLKESRMVNGMPQWWISPFDVEGTLVPIGGKNAKFKIKRGRKK